MYFVYQLYNKHCFMFQKLCWISNNSDLIHVLRKAVKVKVIICLI